MAEFEEIAEGVEEAIEGAEEGTEGLSEEVQEEIQAEIDETRTVIEDLSKTQSKLRGVLKSLKHYSPVIAKFVAKNMVIGAILWGVNIVLNKLFPQEHQQETKTKIRNVIKALSDVIKAEAAINQKTLDWMKAHENDTITLEGIEVPMESILAKYIQPLVEATDKAQTIADSLQEKVDGKTQFKCPTADDMRKFMDVNEVFIKVFTDLIEFVLKHEDQVKVLQSFPVKEGDLVDLTAKLNAAKDLPLW